MRALLVAAVAGLAAADSSDYNSFTPVLHGYSGNGCNATQLYEITLSEHH